MCPNRANVVIALPDGRHQILHVDRMCNECGNCAVFCPYDSAPYRDKFTLFLTREGFDESTENQGFLPLEGRKVLVRLDGKVFEADLDGQNRASRRRGDLHPDGSEGLRLSAVILPAKQFVSLQINRLQADALYS